jgi:cytoskeletal protein RodZ
VWFKIGELTMRWTMTLTIVVVVALVIGLGATWWRGRQSSPDWLDEGNRRR